MYRLSLTLGGRGSGCIDCLLHKEGMGGVYRLSLTLGGDGRGV